MSDENKKIEERVIEIVCEQMGASRDKITPETSFIQDLGADSLDTVELVMEFEDEFDLNIPTRMRRRSRPSATPSSTSTKTRSRLAI